MFMFADAIADGGVKMGLSRDMALKLSFQTMKGASELMQKQYGIKHHMQMKDEVIILIKFSYLNILNQDAQRYAHQVEQLFKEYMN